MQNLSFSPASSYGICNSSQYALPFQDICPTHDVSDIANQIEQGAVPRAFYNLGKGIRSACDAITARIKGVWTRKEPEVQKVQIDQAQKKALQKVLDILVAAPKKGDIVQPHDNFLTVKLLVPQNTLFRKGKQINKLTFWFNAEGYKATMKEDTNTPKARLSFTYKDKTKEVCAFPIMKPMAAGVNLVLTFYSNLIAVGSKVELAFLHQNDRIVVDWKKYLAEDTNNVESTQTYYEKSRAKIAQMFVKKLRDNPLLLEKAKACTVQLFSFGCGNGDDVKAVYQALQHEFDITPQSFGMDLNPANFDQSKDASFNGILLEAGDINQLDTWVAKHVDDNAFKLGLFMGSLTYMVCPSSYAALKSIHSVKDFDLVIIGGYTPILLDENIIEASGSRVILKETNSEFDETPSKRVILKPEIGLIRPDSRNHYILEPMHDDERRIYLRQKSTKRSVRSTFDCLDISCSSKPMRDLGLFEKGDEFTFVDISWCDFTKEELHDFVEELENRQDQPYRLIVSGDEPWFDDFSKLNCTKCTRIIRTDHRKDEIAPFAPHTAKRIGVYKKFPFKPCF